MTLSRTSTARWPLFVVIAFAFSLAATMTTTTYGETAVTPDAGMESVQFSMAVRPGEPVPMRIVTEKSSGELYKKGFRGQGIDVALVDSGVTPVVGLDQPGKLAYGPDLSNEAGFENLATFSLLMGFALMMYLDATLG